MSLDSAAFRNLLGRFASGVTVVTAVDPTGGDAGMTVSAFCSLSLEPPLVLACIAHDATMHSLLVSSTHFAVNILSSGQEEIARRFAETEITRFEGIGFDRGREGMALLEDVLAHAECRLITTHEAGDHTVIVGEVETASVHGGDPLLYYRGGYVRLDR